MLLTTAAFAANRTPASCVMTHRVLVEPSAVRAKPDARREREVWTLVCLALLLAIVALAVRAAATL